jgi:Uncharacterized protein conserved in bacteria
VIVKHSVSAYVDAFHQPWWILMGGLMGLLIVFTITYAGPRIGTAPTLGILIAGQLVMGAAIDKWGLFGSEQVRCTGRASSGSCCSGSAPGSR